MKNTSIHILLVEDNPDHAELLVRSLEKLPIRVRLHAVEDGETALEYVYGRGRFADRGQFPAPDVVLLDWRLPRLDGVEVLKELKSSSANTQLPVVVLTTSDQERDLSTAIRLRADKFLTKPADAQVLLRLLTELGFNSTTEAGRNISPGISSPGIADSP